MIRTLKFLLSKNNLKLFSIKTKHINQERLNDLVI